MNFVVGSASLNVGWSNGMTHSTTLVSCIGTWTPYLLTTTPLVHYLSGIPLSSFQHGDAISLAADV